ncbi:hypothetical protein Tco_1354753 [Tanacetum coccineum]
MIVVSDVALKRDGFPFDSCQETHECNFSIFYFHGHQFRHIQLVRGNDVLFSTGNGESVSIWFDKWDLKGPLCDIIPRRYWYKERYTDNETVAAIPTLSVGIKDKVYWSDNQNDKTEFSTKQFWSDLRVLMRKWIGVMLFGLSNFNLDMLSCYGWE